MKLHQIITIGYEGADFEDFLATLKLLDVSTLLDVRELPISRRKGFAKNALREGLESIGVQYRHEPRLGSPRDIRHQLRDDGDLDWFFGEFRRYLSGQKPLLDTLAKELSGSVALLCYERDHTTCHRKVVAEALARRTGLKPRHRGVQGYAQRKAAAHSCPNLGESLSTA